MGLRIINEAYKFTPAEAAKVTGVSVETQRNWRRAKIINARTDSGWNSFEAPDIVRLTVLKIGADAGFYVNRFEDVADISVMPILALINRQSGGVEYDDSVPEWARDRNIAQGSGTDGQRWIVAAQNGNDPKGRLNVARFTFLEEIGRWHNQNLWEENRPLAFTLLDLELIAHTIIERAGHPLYRVIAEEQEVAS